MNNKINSILLLIILIFSVTGSTFANEMKNQNYSIGWQFSRPMTGLSVKIPVGETCFLQPVISFSISEDNTLSKGKYSTGVRLLVNLTKRSDFLPYAGISAGYFKRYQKNAGSILESISENGYEAFFGVEYQKYIIRPSVEIGMGSYIKKNGDYYAGPSINAGLTYYF